MDHQVVKNYMQKTANSDAQNAQTAQFVHSVQGITAQFAQVSIRPVQSVHEKGV